MMKDVIFNECCLKTMSRMPDKCIDVVVTSPPYNMNLRINKGRYMSRQITKEFSTKYEGFSDNMPIEEFFDFHKTVMRELLRVSNLVFYNISIVTGSKRAFFKLIGEFSEEIKDIVIWDKVNAQPAMQEGVLNRQYEMILILSSDSGISRKFEEAKFERGTLNDVWEIKRGSRRIKGHSAVFPEELVEKIVRNFTEVGDLIYDPFLGSGTTAIVARSLGRNYCGSELLTHYFNIAKSELNNGLLF